MSYDGRVYRVEVGSEVREFPLFRVAPDVNIAIFNMLGDTAIVEESARLLTELMPADADVLIVPEVKAVPLGHALSVHSGLPYAVVRKVLKPYMANSLSVEVVSITTGKPQTLHLDGKDRRLVDGKNVVLVDDVVSTGSTFEGLRKLMNAANAAIVGEMAVFSEGNGDSWPHVITLGHLPIFPDQV
ncbi:MAG: adenine phosphoribosyltransferase [Caldilineaceae bacterium]|nr:adenine phosphoribosyltransferase [Caldilineaceae bacterium]